MPRPVCFFMFWLEEEEEGSGCGASVAFWHTWMRPFVALRSSGAATLSIPLPFQSHIKHRCVASRWTDSGAFDSGERLWSSAVALREWRYLMWTERLGRFIPFWAKNDEKTRYFHNIKFLSLWWTSYHLIFFGNSCSATTQLPPSNHVALITNTNAPLITPLFTSFQSKRQR